MLEKWINEKFAEIAERLPVLVHSDPASFACGFNAGYKQCLLEIDRILRHNEGEDNV